MKETRSSGIVQILYVLIMSAAVDIIAAAVRYFILPDNLNIAGIVLEIALFCIVAYEAMTHYAAVFEYSWDNRTFRATRTIGRRTKEIEVKAAHIRRISRTAPENGGKRDVFSRCIFSRRGRAYLVYTDSSGALSAIEFEPSDALYAAIENRKEMTNG